MKKIRRIINQIAKTPISETVDLANLKFLFPYNWKDKLKELKASKFKSKLFPD